MAYTDGVNSLDDKRETEILLNEAAGGDQDAFARLSEKYNFLVLSLVGSFADRIPADVFNREDLYQESLMAFYRAVKTYRKGNGEVTFGLYAKTCIRNRLVSLQRKAYTVKKRETAVLKKERAGKTNLLLSFSDLSFENDADGGKNAEKALLDSLYNSLTYKERAVLDLLAKGYSYREIAEELEIKEKAVDNALVRVRRKLKQFISSK